MKKSTPLVKLQSFHAPYFFPIDEMHLLGPNLGKQLWKMLCGKIKGPLRLKKKYRTLIGKAMVIEDKRMPTVLSAKLIDTYTS